MSGNLFTLTKKVLNVPNYPLFERCITFHCFDEQIQIKQTHFIRKANI